MTPAPLGSMITLQLCRYSSTTYIEQLSYRLLRFRPGGMQKQELVVRAHHTGLCFAFFVRRAD